MVILLSVAGHYLCPTLSIMPEIASFSKYFLGL